MYFFTNIILHALNIFLEGAPVAAFCISWKKGLHTPMIHSTWSYQPPQRSTHGTTRLTLCLIWPLVRRRGEEDLSNLNVCAGKLRRTPRLASQTSDDTHVIHDDVTTTIEHFGWHTNVNYTIIIIFHWNKQAVKENILLFSPQLN